MQPTFSELKNAARSALKHRWAEAVAVTLVLIATSFLNTFIQYILMSVFKVRDVWTPFTPTDLPMHSQIASVGITLFSAVFSFFVMFPLVFGVMRWFWFITAGGDIGIGEIFYYFSSGKVFFKSVGLSVRLYLRLIIGAVVSFLPYLAAAIFTTPYIYDRLNIKMPVFMESLSPLAQFLKAFGFLAFLMWISIYLLCYTVIFSEPQLTVGQIIRRTVKISKGFRFNMVCFFFSFFGWILLSFLLLPLIFAGPYMLSAFAVYGREVYRASKHSVPQAG